MPPPLLPYLFLFATYHRTVVSLELGQKQNKNRSEYRLDFESMKPACIQYIDTHVTSGYRRDVFDVLNNRFTPSSVFERTLA